MLKIVFLILAIVLPIILVGIIIFGRPSKKTSDDVVFLGISIKNSYPDDEDIYETLHRNEDFISNLDKTEISERYY